MNQDMNTPHLDPLLQLTNFFYKYLFQKWDLDHIDPNIWEKINVGEISGRNTARQQSTSHINYKGYQKSTQKLQHIE